CLPQTPALAPLVASIALLLLSPGRTAASRGTAKSGLRWSASLPILAGLLFGLGLQLKLIGIIYSPLILFVLWIRSAPRDSSVKRKNLRSAPRLFATSCFFFAACTFFGFIAINWLTGSPLSVQLQQAWAAHFASAKSSEYGSAQEHVY